MGGRGSGGKNRKPSVIKKAQGNPGKRAINAKEPPAIAGEPRMPSGMTDQAKAVWPEVVSILKENGVLFKTDGIAIATLCSNLVLFWQSDRAVQKYGSLLVQDLDEGTGVGTLKINSAVRVRSDAEKKLRASWQAFGLDPSSRAGIHLPEKTSDRETALQAILRAKSAKDEIVH